MSQVSLFAGHGMTRETAVYPADDLDTLLPEIALYTTDRSTAKYLHNYCS